MASEKIVQLTDAAIHLADAGEGNPALVFLHYWGGSRRTWAPVIEKLSTASRCVAIDFRGWGRSSKVAGAYDLETFADDVVGIVERLGLTDYIVAGHSMGGKVAQLVAAQRPRGLTGLILLAPAPPTPITASLEQRQGMIASYETRAGVEEVIGILAALPLSEAHRAQVVEDSSCGAPEAKRAWPDRGMIEDIGGSAGRIDVPVHVIVGSADNVEPEKSLRAVFGSVIPVADFVVLPGVGHLAPLEAPTEVASAIRNAQVAMALRNG